MAYYSPYTSKVDIVLTKSVRHPKALASADGAITLKSGFVFITKAGVAALTLADPVAADEGKVLSIISTTAQLHTVTSAGGFNGGGAASDVASFAAAIGNSITVVAYNLKWWVVNLQGVTLA